MYKVEVCNIQNIKQKHKRYFNTSEPNIRERHYTLERKVLAEEGSEMADGESIENIESVEVTTYLYDLKKDF